MAALFSRKFYFNDDDEISTTVYFRHEYDYPLYEDYIAELNGVVDFAGLMMFTIIQPVRHRRLNSKLYNSNERCSSLSFK